MFSHSPGGRERRPAWKVAVLLSKTNICHRICLFCLVKSMFPQKIFVLLNKTISFIKKTLVLLSKTNVFHRKCSFCFVKPMFSRSPGGRERRPAWKVHVLLRKTNIFNRKYSFRLVKAMFFIEHICFA